jgi:putative membrane protein
MKNTIAYGTALLVLSVAPLLSQAGGSSASASNSGADHPFVTDAARGGMAEVELGNLAKQKAQSEDVKKFADRMVQDHTKANGELKSIAQKQNINLPTDLDSKSKATKDRLEKLSGAEFDRAYVQDMLSDHRKDVSDFRKESQSGKDSEVKAWAAKTLPTLEEHLKLAEDASKSVVGTSGRPSSEGNRTNGGTRGTTVTSPGSGSSGGATGSSGTSPR